MENTIGIIPNTFHDFQKKFKSDTFENYKSFVVVEVQSLVKLFKKEVPTLNMYILVVLGISFNT